MYLEHERGDFPSVFEVVEDDEDDNDDDDDDDYYSGNTNKKQQGGGGSKHTYTHPSALDSNASAIDVIRAWSYRLKGNDDRL